MTQSLLDSLAVRTLELVDIPSVSLGEAAIARHVAKTLPSSFEQLYRADDSILAVGPRSEGRPLVLLAGHLDTVPAQENLPGAIVGGSVAGLGSSDMKGGLAVMLELADWIDRERPQLTADLALLFFPREELPSKHSALPAIFKGAPVVREADLVVVLEPTDNAIHAGCLGNLNANLVFDGEAGHSARPWEGDNAVHHAVTALAPIAQVAARDVEVQGLTFVEVLSITRIEGGVAANVIPDHVVAGINYRYAPGQTPVQAEARLRELVGTEGTLEIVGNSPAAHVAAQTELVLKLIAAGDLEIKPKQAWTPVAEFSEQGLDAINFGPGAPSYAHRRDEQIGVDALLRSLETFQAFLTT